VNNALTPEHFSQNFSDHFVYVFLGSVAFDNITVLQPRLCCAIRKIVIAWGWSSGFQGMGSILFKAFSCFCKVHW
jgi:hypothetical protein